MNPNPTWQKELLDTAEALEEEALLLTLLCGAALSSSPPLLRRSPDPVLPPASGLHGAAHLRPPDPGPIGRPGMKKRRGLLRRLLS